MADLHRDLYSTTLWGAMGLGFRDCEDVIPIGWGCKLCLWCLGSVPNFSTYWKLLISFAGITI